MIINDDNITAINIAGYFLTKKELTPKKLQKLVYYAYAWFIALNNDSAEHIDNVLFTEQPQAWVHGPVFPSLFREYRELGWHEIPRIDDKIVFENDDVQALLDAIWDKFGKYSADQLEAMTHSEQPWVEARKGYKLLDASDKTLNLKTIFAYYNGLLQKAE